jgi:hypothetical protein
MLREKKPMVAAMKMKSGMVVLADGFRLPRKATARS